MSYRPTPPTAGALLAAVALLVGGCSTTPGQVPQSDVPASGTVSEDHTSGAQSGHTTGAAIDTAESGEAASGTANEPSPNETPRQEENEMNVIVDIDGRALEVELADNPTARSLIELLPVTITLRDYGGQEKIGALPRPLSMDAAPASGHGAPGVLGYYSPNQSLVLYYTDAGSWSGIVPIGTLDTDLSELASIPDGTPLSITKK